MTWRALRGSQKPKHLGDAVDAVLELVGAEDVSFGSEEALVEPPVALGPVSKVMANRMYWSSQSVARLASAAVWKASVRSTRPV
jgi:hypothetical protein